MNKLLLIGFTVIMFFFKNLAMSNYEKVFFDFKIENIQGEKLILKVIKTKLFFW